MTWSIFEGKHGVALKAAFSEKYTLTIDTDIMAGSLPIKTKSELRWDVRVMEANQQEAILEILTLDNRLLESNNPMVKDIAAMSQALSQMYSELKVSISAEGRVKQILNKDTILSKWGTLKAELINIQENNASVKSVIQLNDELFTAPQKMVAAVEGNEFFLMYFHHFYNTRLPTYTPALAKRTLLNTASLMWRYQIDPVVNYEAEPVLGVTIKGITDTSIDSSWKKAAYKDFTHLPIADLKPRFEENGSYEIEKSTGRLLEAGLVKKETVHPSLLYATISYHMVSDTVAQKAKKAQENKPATPPSGHPSKPGGFPLLMD
jgi:hypothetical protein